MTKKKTYHKEQIYKIYQSKRKETSKKYSKIKLNNNSQELLELYQKLEKEKDQMEKDLINFLDQDLEESLKKFEKDAEKIITDHSIYLYNIQFEHQKILLSLELEHTTAVARHQQKYEQEHLISFYEYYLNELSAEETKNEKLINETKTIFKSKREELEQIHAKEIKKLERTISRKMEKLEAEYETFILEMKSFTVKTKKKKRDRKRRKSMMF